MPIRLASFPSGPSRRPAGPSCRGGASSLLRQGPVTALHRPAPARIAGWRAGAAAFAGDTVEHVITLPGALAAVEQR